MDQLPYEIIIEIFLYLSQRYKNEAKLVCKKWNQLLKDPLFYRTITLSTPKQWNTFSSFATVTKIKNKYNQDIPLGHFVRQLIFKKDTSHFYSYDLLKPLQLACPFLTEIKNFPFINDFSTHSFSFSPPTTFAPSYESASDDDNTTTTISTDWPSLIHLPLEYTHIAGWKDKVNDKTKSLQLFFYNPLFYHDTLIDSYSNRRLRIKLLEKQRRLKSVQENDYWRVAHTNYTEYIWHSTKLISLPILNNLVTLDINFNLYFYSYSSSTDQLDNNDDDNNNNNNNGDGGHRQQQLQHYEIDGWTLQSLMDACPNMVILKLRYLTFNFSNNHDQHQLSTTLFQPLNPLQHLYLDHCTFLNPQCYSFFSSCKFPHLKTLDAHMIWQPFININHPDTTVKYKHSIYHMITSFRLLSHLNLHYQLKKEDHYQMDSFHFNQLMLPNHELLEWLSANPKQLTFFGYDYDLLTTTNNYNYNNNNSNNIREPYLSYYYNNNPWQQSYLNHLTTLYFKNISTFLLNIETAATVLSTSLRTFIISGDKKIIPSCSIYYWLNAFPYLQKLKISRMKIIGSSSSTLYAPSYHRNSSSSGAYYHHLRGLVLKKSELRLENEGGLEGLLKRCLKVNTIELNQLKIATPSLWYQKGNYKSSIPFFIDASHLRLDHLVLMNITFYPLLTSSLSPSSSVANPFLNYHHDYSFYYWDTLLNQYKTYYTIEEMGSTKDIIHYPSHDQLENNNTFTINFYLKCQSIDQLEFY